jgi:glutathione synthase/RimK-type ligase-like ATP-grasp enzyme
MKIAIHQKESGFSPKWIDYCKTNRIEYKIVNCYSNAIIEDLKDCDALMWHFSQASSKDILFAKQLMFSLETAGKVVFPDFHTAWHFDDKVGQKYLLESIGAPLVPSYVFYNRQEALEWVEETEFPKVFKLRGGAGSANVRIVKDKTDARELVNKAFGRGFSQYDKWGSLKERWYQYRKGKMGVWNVMKGVLRFGRTTEMARVAGRDRGYIYFQEFIPENDFDIRVVVIDGKAFAIKRMVREGDFRASGSWNILYEKKHFNDETIRLAFEIAKKLKGTSVALDFIYDREGEPLVVEVSYAFTKEGYYDCVGYWTKDMDWHEGTFDAQGWMVESVVKEIERRKDL